jgi:hypothetical protein
MLVKWKRFVIGCACCTGFRHERRRRKNASDIGVGAVVERVITVDHPHNVPAGTPKSPRCQIRKQPVGFATEPSCRIDNQARGFILARTLVHVQ